MNETEIIGEAYRYLQANRAFDALTLLWNNLADTSFQNSPALYLAHARMVGHIGDYSEALRCTEEIRADPGAADEWTRRAAICSAVFWCRLGEYNRAGVLLAQYPPPENDPEYAVLHWSHRLTIAAETRDQAMLDVVLGDAGAVENRASTDSAYAAELEIWKLLLVPMVHPEPLSTKAVEDTVSAVHGLEKRLKKKSARHYILFRIAQLWTRAGGMREACELLECARQDAVAANNGFGYVRATLDLLDITSSLGDGVHPVPGKILTDQALVVAGQLGIGLLPCRLSYQIWRLAGSLGSLGDRHRRWLHAERYRPDITRLTDTAFEKWCQIFLGKYLSQLLHLSNEGKLETLPDGAPIIDFVFTHPSGSKIGIQCKGGTTRWPKSRLRELHLDEGMDALKESQFTHYVFLCTTRLETEAQKVLNNLAQRHKLRVTIIDETVLETYLLQDPGLRLQLCIHAVEDVVP